MSTATNDWFLSDIPWDYFPDEELVHAKAFTDDIEVIKYFTLKQCNALAWELYKLRQDKKYQLAMLSDDKAGSKDYMGHVFVIDANQDVAIDINGVVTLDEMFEAWPRLGYFHVFRSPAAFRKEMQDWINTPHYARDPEAKYWAKFIDDILE